MCIRDRNSGGMPGDDVAALADYALMLNRLTDGAYDMTILPIMELWGFTTGEYAVPGAVSYTHLCCFLLQANRKLQVEQNYDVIEHIYWLSLIHI